MTQPCRFLASSYWNLKTKLNNNLNNLECCNFLIRSFIVICQSRTVQKYLLRSSVLHLITTEVPPSCLFTSIWI